jgi:heme o synthase
MTALPDRLDKTPTAARLMSCLRSPVLGDYLSLLKPRVMSLVLLTAATGFLLAPHPPTLSLGALILLEIAAGAGACGVINMWYESDIDALMTRTRNRPIPSGRIAPAAAIWLGVALAVFAIGSLAATTNLLAAGLLALSIGIYLGVYTIWLKRRTPFNIVIGGAAGALPTVVGTAAVGGHVTLASLSLFCIIFLWTPPHFWSLALLKSADYARAGVPMLPVVAGPDATRRQILLYALLLAPVGAAPWLIGAASGVYGAVSTLAGLAFVALACVLFRERTGHRGERAARRLFQASLLYLTVLFLALIVERVVFFQQH